MSFSLFSFPGSSDSPRLSPPPPPPTLLSSSSSPPPPPFLSSSSPPPRPSALPPAAIKSRASISSPHFGVSSKCSLFSSSSSSSFSTSPSSLKKSTPDRRHKRCLSFILRYSTFNAFCAEFIGTLLFVLIVGLNVLHPNPFACYSIGAVLTLLVYALINVSGAHFNPAVTYAVWLCNIFSSSSSSSSSSSFWVSRISPFSSPAEVSSAFPSSSSSSVSSNKATFLSSFTPSAALPVSMPSASSYTTKVLDSHHSSMYICLQYAGGFVAALMYWLWLGNTFMFRPRDGHTIYEAFVMETLGSFFFVLVVLGLSENRRGEKGSFIRQIQGLITGVMFMAAYLASVRISGGSLNPATASAAATTYLLHHGKLATSTWDMYLPYWIGPYLGATAAAASFRSWFYLLKISSSSSYQRPYLSSSVYNIIDNLPFSETQDEAQPLLLDTSFVFTSSSSSAFHSPPPPSWWHRILSISSPSHPFFSSSSSSCDTKETTRVPSSYEDVKRRGGEEGGLLECSALLRDEREEDVDVESSEAMVGDVCDNCSDKNSQTTTTSSTYYDNTSDGDDIYCHDDDDVVVQCHDTKNDDRKRKRKKMTNKLKSSLILDKQRTISDYSKISDSHFYIGDEFR